MRSWMDLIPDQRATCTSTKYQETSQDEEQQENCESTAHGLAQDWLERSFPQSLRMIAVAPLAAPKTSSMQESSRSCRRRLVRTLATRACKLGSAPAVRLPAEFSSADVTNHPRGSQEKPPEVQPPAPNPSHEPRPREALCPNPPFETEQLFKFC